MNFLAHLLLSPRHPEMLVGNLAADFLRGYDIDCATPKMREGITMHQFVDRFTDTHPVFRRSMERLTNFRLLSSILVDVFYDYYLATAFADYTAVPLREFSDDAYQALQRHHDILPPSLQRFAPFMVAQDMLFCYRKLSGIEAALHRINYLLSRKFDVALAMREIQTHDRGLAMDFAEFFPQIIAATKHYRRKHSSILLGE